MRRLEGRKERERGRETAFLLLSPPHLGSVGCFCQTDSDLDETADETPLLKLRASADMTWGWGAAKTRPSLHRKTSSAFWAGIAS